MINDKLLEQIKEQIDEIIESGNGYIKYKDGTLLCYGLDSTNTTGYISISFPITFISIPIVVVQQQSGSETTNIITAKTSTIDKSYFRCGCVYAQGYLQQNINWIAIGKWK